MAPFYRQLDTQQYKPALALIETLLTELKRLDDKLVLTEVHLLESRVYRGVGNLAKAKVRPTSSRINSLANAILTASLCFPRLRSHLRAPQPTQYTVHHNFKLVSTFNPASSMQRTRIIPPHTPTSTRRSRT